jgi:hypothetical protein
MAAPRCCTKIKKTNPSRSVLVFMIYSANGATIILGSAAYSSDLKQSSSPHAAANTHGGDYVFYSPPLPLKQVAINVKLRNFALFLSGSFVWLYVWLIKTKGLGR